MRVMLLGLMGAGKTRVGEALAALQGVPYLDNDLQVERRAGLSKAALVEARGEGALREVESALVRELLEREGPFVAGLPAGAVLDPSVQQDLAAHAPDVKLVWLRAQTDTLVARLTSDPMGRPWLAPELLAALSALAPPREAFYRTLADVVVDVEGATPEALAARIVEALGAEPTSVG